MKHVFLGAQKSFSTKHLSCSARLDNFKPTTFAFSVGAAGRVSAERGREQLRGQGQAARGSRAGGFS